MFDTPILIIGWRRPNHLFEVINSIKVIKPTKIFVVIDGYREGEEYQLEREQIDACKKVVLDEINWPCNLTTLFREINLGCGVGVSDAINWFFNQVEEGIILEDDCVPRISFLNFCSELLEFYRFQNEIMHIGGHSLGVKHQMNFTSSYFFSCYPHIWGWATWRRAWKMYKFNYEIPEMISIIENSINIPTKIEKEAWTDSLISNLNVVDTWDYQWLLTIWKYQGLSILPRFNIVENIGFGAEAVHTKNENLLSSQSNYEEILFVNHPKTIKFKTEKESDMQISNHHFEIRTAISPVTLTDNVKYLKSFSVNQIIKGYLDQFGIDVKENFKNLPEISLFQCNESNLRFYYPALVMGDDRFYGELERFEWYYNPWKWEHEKAALRIKNGMKILEVGCGNGDFLSKIQNDYNGIETQGLELNQSAAKKAREKGINVLCKKIEEFKEIEEGIFDIICSFQVLEHLIEVESFFDSHNRLLKNDGEIIISVPNNQSFIKWNEWNLLNLPPHHMTLWDKTSLKKVASMFSLKIKCFKYEPLQSYHFDWYMNSLEIKYFSKDIRKRIFNFLRLKIIIRKLLPLFSSIIKGHSIVVVLKK